MNKIIFTADDFGVVPSLNEGITHLVNRGLINSVEVFTNFDKSVGNVKQLLVDTNEANFELGAHLTITSGKPITNSTGLEPLLLDGQFREFSRTNSGADNLALYNELKAQIEVLLDEPTFSERITHVTCHHDALWFFPEYTKQLARISKEYNLPLRNPKSYPPKRDKMYYTIVLPILKALSFSMGDIDLMKSTFQLRKNQKFPNENLSYRAPDFMDSRHYGPIPQIPIPPEKKANKILKKQKSLEKMLRKAIAAGGKNENKLIEFMFHVRKGEISGSHKGFREEMAAVGYSGINPDYFDSRTIEFESLRFYEEAIKVLEGKDFEFGSWKDSKTHTLLSKKLKSKAPKRKRKV